MSPDYDLCIIGGGINGAGIARDAAGRGLRVLLVEKGDLAGATSSASTKLIHGGLRYLEYWEFGLVRDSLREREVLLNLAPHVIRPLKFVLPHDRLQRPYWMIGLGLLLYDTLARRRRLPGSGRIDLIRHPFGRPLQGRYTKGFHYTDCWADDSRLVALNALDAAERGAEILTRTECTGLRAQDGRWVMTLKDKDDGSVRYATAAMAVNAAGPWVRRFIDSCGFGAPDVPRVRLVKGSHIIVKQAFEGEHAYIVQQPDRRIVFAIPYENGFTLIGTTEEKFSGEADDIRISDHEIDYLCAAFNASFNRQIGRGDILWAYSGVRPLLDDGRESATSVTRDYTLHMHRNTGPALLSVFGGKLTTYRVLSEKVVDMLLLQQGKTPEPWTAEAPLPGGEIPHADFDLFWQKKSVSYGWLPEPLLRRYAMAYGARMDRFLEGAQSPADLGRHFGDGLYEAEVIYLVRNEWARSDEDILWRRSKLGLHVSEKTVKNLKDALPGLLKKAAA